MCCVGEHYVVGCTKEIPDRVFWLHVIQCFLQRESADVPSDPPEVLHLSPYEKGHVIMTLHDFINHPAAMELLHNGATFQVPSCVYGLCLVCVAGFSHALPIQRKAP